MGQASLLALMASQVALSAAAGKLLLTARSLPSATLQSLLALGVASLSNALCFQVSPASPSASRLLRFILDNPLIYTLTLNPCVVSIFPFSIRHMWCSIVLLRPRLLSY